MPEESENTQVSGHDDSGEFFHPGLQLKRERMAQNLSQKEIANKLFLSTRVIIDIEAGEYRKIGALTFTRGYIRLYARLLGLPEDDIVQSFNQLDLKEMTSDGVTDKKAPARVQITARSLKWLTYLIIASLLVLVVLWARSHYQTNDSAQNLSAEALSQDRAGSVEVANRIDSILPTHEVLSRMSDTITQPDSLVTMPADTIFVTNE